MKRILLLVALFGVTACFSQAKYDTLPNLPQHYTDLLAKFRAEPSSTGVVLFLGNSITEGGNWKRLLGDSSVLNRGISGDNTFGVLGRLDEVIRHKPSKIFILIGVNDLSKNIPAAVVARNILSIARKLKAGSPETALFVQSILPINPNVKGFPTRFSKMPDILEINRQLTKNAASLKFTYVDIHRHFSDSNGQLDARYTYDGLHLTNAGYAHWIEFLKKNNLL